ncbi:MAG: hypothetical protein JW863_10965 [Chitinispirillaceae bacterium]|nr:hypothetical protein [Chitinispirillaceae bacterium]
MKTIIGILLVMMIGTVVAEDAEKAAESRIRIGVLSLETFDKASEIVGKAQSDLIALLREIGFYQCYDQAVLTEGLEKLKKRIPKHCRDPRCVLDIGTAAGMDRMLFGSVEWGNSKRCGIRLTLIDVLTKQTIESVNIQGAEGVPVEEVLKSAVGKLHGQEDAAEDMESYFGPEVHNEKQMLISTAGCLGVGLLYSLINFGVEQDMSTVDADYRKYRLSGLPTTGVPLFARPAALANAYVALSDDAYGVLYNPAGMAWVSGPEAVLAYQYRFGLDNVAASYVNKGTREIGFGQALLYRSDREQLMTELMFVSAFAYKFNNLPLNFRPLSLGVNVKILGTRVRSTSEFSSGGNSFGAGLDLGLMWELSDQIRYGLLFRDVPVINYWKNVKAGYSYAEAQAATLAMGGIFRVGYSTMLIAEGNIPLYEDQSWKMAGGLEQELFTILLLRIGIQREIMAVYAPPWKITGGFGLKVNTEQFAGKYLSLDGSYEYNTLQVFDVINISLRFGF